MSGKRSDPPLPQRRGLGGRFVSLPGRPADPGAPHAVVGTCREMGAAASGSGGPGTHEWIDGPAAGCRRFTLWAGQTSRSPLAGTGTNATPALGRGAYGGARLDL